MLVSSALLGAAAGATAVLRVVSDEGPAVRVGKGDKQGPLLLLDKLRSELATYLQSQGTSTIDTFLESAPAPSDDAWRLPQPPEIAEDGWVFVPPMPRNCNNSSGGTGIAIVEADEHRDRFRIDVRSGPSEHAWAMASPCLAFTPDRDGTVLARTAIVLYGAVAADSERQGATLARITAWIAHCHPQELGRYSERMGFSTNGMAGTVQLSNFVLLHQTQFPVQAGVEHLFGTGVVAACAAKAGAVGMKLSGRIAYMTVEMLE
ncbi:MAG: hypothetical protein AB7Y46_05860 [Armatimonadota bacterium]